jgi:16S rRNA (uracil1498-N3)-methyltransferase
VNVILFDNDSDTQRLPRSDLRAQHILNVLKCRPGDLFQAGVINGPLGRGTVASVDKKDLVLSFSWIEAPLPSEEISFIIGLPRPQTARKILNTLSTLGASVLHFVQTDKSDRNYLSSKLWSTDEWSRHLIDGAQQGFSTRLPDVHWDSSLYKTLKTISTGATRIALDNYEGQDALGQTEINLPLVMAIGPEQGWSDRDREILVRHGFRLSHLGQRVLRVETACVSALAIAKSKLGLM